MIIGAPEEIRTPDPLVRSQVLYPAELRAHIPFEIGAPEEIRTPDPLVRSQVLYPAELRARERYYNLNLFIQSCINYCETGMVKTGPTLFITPDCRALI